MKNEEISTSQTVHEFLVWLLWVTEVKGQKLEVRGEKIEVCVDKKILFSSEKETATIASCEPGRAAEAKTALLSGKKVSEMGLFIKRDEKEFSVVLKSPDLSMSALKIPSFLEGGDPEEVLYDRQHLYEEANFIICEIFKKFSEMRTSSEWVNVKQKIHEWVKA